MRAFAKPGFPPRMMKTGDSPMSRLSQARLLNWLARNALVHAQPNWSRSAHAKCCWPVWSLSNGLFVARAFTLLANLPKGVTVGSLAEADLKNDPASLEAAPRTLSEYSARSFAALNTAFIEDGAFVHVPRGSSWKRRFMCCLCRPRATPAMNPSAQPDRRRTKNSQVTVVEDYVSLGGGTRFLNAATELVAGDNANVSHYMIEREAEQAFNFSTLRIQQGRKRQRRHRTLCFWAERWCATTCIRCWQAREASA